MSERKVLNKYYPPDFDPNKIPKLRLPRNRQYSIRIMAPFNMRCGTCGEYIYKGKKFNSRKETVENENYLGLHIFRFYIKCPRCVAEIAFKTDPENTDYTLEAGATRNFEALRTAEEMAKREQKEKEAEEKNNPMKVLENRTKSSLQEMEMIETLEELRDLNSRHAKVDHESMLQLHKAYEEQLQRLQDEEDENLVKSVFGKTDDGKYKRLHDDSDEEETERSKVKVNKLDKPTDILTQETVIDKKVTEKKPAVWERSIGGLSSSKTKLQSLVKKKTTDGQQKIQTPELPSADKTKNDNKQNPTQKPTDTKEAKSTITTAPVTNGTEAGKASTGALSGLGMLGGYSDSDDSGNTSE